MPCTPLSKLGGPGVTSGPPSIDNCAHDTEMLLLKIQVSEDFS